MIWQILLQKLVVQAKSNHCLDRHRLVARDGTHLHMVILEELLLSTEDSFEKLHRAVPALREEDLA